MKIIVHAGMHQTGTAALQSAFHQGSGTGYTYLSYDGPNLSRVLSKCFTDIPALSGDDAKSPTTDIDPECAKIRDRLDAQIQDCTQPALLVSAEALSINSGERQKNVADWLNGHSNDIQVISYVRPPLAYMKDAFLERLKTGFTELNASKLFPYYRGRFWGLLLHFKRQQCTFVTCDDTLLENGNLIADFAKRSGLTAPETEAQTGGPEFSAAAVCLLYLYRKEVQAAVPKEREDMVGDRNVVDFLRRITGPRFQLSPDIFGADKPRFQSHIDWMERYVDKPLAEEQDADATLFATEQDLLDGANDAYPALKIALDQIGLLPSGDLVSDLRTLQEHLRSFLRSQLGPVTPTKPKNSALSKAADTGALAAPAAQKAKPSRPDLRIIVHAGMHKTGSTSLQLSFAGDTSDKYHYLLGAEPNFSMSMFLMFEDEDKLQDHLYHRISQVSQEELLTKRAELTKFVDEQISQSPQPTLVVSGEDISGYNHRVIARLADYLRSFSEDISVITYVRPPSAYMESAFQERLKHQLVEPDPIALWPRYQKRLQNVIDAFGVENNSFVKFDRKGLENENVIDDFSTRVGLPRPKDIDAEANTSMSAEAVALTYAYRKLLDPTPPSGIEAQETDRLFLHRLETIGQGKLRFDKSFLETGRAYYDGDLAWMESHLGVSLDETRSSGAGHIAGSTDLIEQATENLPALKALNESLGIEPADTLEDNLIALRKACADHGAHFLV